MKRTIALTVLLALIACSRTPPPASDLAPSPPTAVPTARPRPTDRPATPTTAPASPTSAPPTPTPAPMATVTRGGNVRRSPINGKPIDVVNARESVQLLGKNKAGTWYLITDMRGVTGWVSAILLKVDPQIAASLPVQPANVLSA